jgi:hypothetical protein
VQFPARDSYSESAVVSNRGKSQYGDMRKARSHIPTYARLLLLVTVNAQQDAKYTNKQEVLGRTNRLLSLIRDGPH